MAQRDAWSGVRSPMESLLAEALRAIGWGGDERHDPRDTAVRMSRNQQVIVGGLSYEFDFAFTWQAVDKPEWTFLDVEVDGHEFHERTKEQARRDRSRDRALTLYGITVVRFTGAEIYADARGCADELDGIVRSEVARRSIAVPLLDQDRDREAYDAVRAIKTLVIDAMESVQMLNNGDMSEPVDDNGTEWRDEHREAVGLLQKASAGCARILG